MKRTEIRKLDKLWSEKIKIIWGYKCARCGRTEYLNSHHIIGKSNFNTRWDLNNGICLCSGCHMWVHYQGLLGTRFIEGVIKAETLSYLENLSGQDLGKRSFEDVLNYFKITKLEVRIMIKTFRRKKR